MKTCTCCSAEKPISDFSNGKGYKNGRYSQCKECRNKNRKKWRHKTGDQRKAILRKYGLTLAMYDAMLHEQSGCCAICGCLPENSIKGILAVDHDHDTGTVRGLLCGLCNSAIGKFKDNILLLQKAVVYLSGSGY